MTRAAIPTPRCCATPRDHRPPFTAYWYRASTGWHCWQCDGRDDMGWQRCLRGAHR